jgi:hypothetical protein
MHNKDVKLKDLLSLVKNKRNSQYSFVLKKRALLNFGISPNNILNIKMPKRKVIKPVKFIPLKK